MSDVDLETEALGPKASAFETGARVSPIVPRTLSELAMVAAAIIKAGLAPDSYTMERRVALPDDKAKARIMIGIMKGAEVGLPPITALSSIAIINNRPCIWGDGAMALVQQAGLIEKVEQFYEGEEVVSEPTEDDRGDKDHTPLPRDFPQTLTAVCRIWRKGQEIPYEGRFSVRDAMRAHLWAQPGREPWIKYPKRMLMQRARAWPLRDGFADALAGLSIREEVEDLPPPPPAKADASFLDALPAPSETPLGMDTASPTLETANAAVQPAPEEEARAEGAE